MKAPQNVSFGDSVIAPPGWREVRWFEMRIFRFYQQVGHSILDFIGKKPI